MTTIEFLISIALLLLVLNLLATLFGKKNNTATADLARLEEKVHSEFANNRSETNSNAQSARQELANAIHSFGAQITGTITNMASGQNNQLETLTTLLQNNAKGNMQQQEQLINTTKQNGEQLEKKFTENLEKIQEVLGANAKTNRDEQAKSLLSFEQKFIGAIANYKSETSLLLDKITNVVENKLVELQKNNANKLEEMRITVDEKLTSTLEKRFTESFTIISTRLEEVHKGLGEMQTIATGVGDLKKVMNNVKVRGVFGEYQLQNILEDMLTTAQYGKNVKPIPHKGTTVEFAIKMPDNNNIDATLWMPIDAKFPKEDYEKLVDAYNDGDGEKVILQTKAFKSAIMKCAKDINEKYLEPPYTTEFGILFLPFESLYAEVLRIPGLMEDIQRIYKVTVCGPTTLSALLNSFQMGFKTLAIQKRSSDVWNILSVVKQEFGLFSTVLEKTHKQLLTATTSIHAASTRTRAIEKQLLQVSTLPDAEYAKKVEESIIEDMLQIAQEVETVDILPSAE
jgi:DNA recombination protein RmuC